MPLSTLDPQSALIVIDLQAGIRQRFGDGGLDDDDIRVTKQTWGAFHGTELDHELRTRGVTQVVITGVATSAGVESTARAAHEHGYHVVLATDAMTDRDPDVHRHSVERIFPRLGQTASSAEIIAAVQQAG